MKKLSATTLSYMDEMERIPFVEPRIAARIFLIAVFGLSVFLVCWASLSQIDEMVHGSGEVVPSMHSQIVQSLEGGIVKEILVREGDKVRKGQVLIRLSAIASASEEKSLEAKRDLLQIQKLRLEAESKLQEFIVPEDIQKRALSIVQNEKDLYRSRQEEYKNAISILESKIDSASAEVAEMRARLSKGSDNIRLLNQELKITSKMVASKAAPQIEEIKLRRELSDAEGELQVSQNKKIGLEADLQSFRQQRKDQEDKFRSQALGELNKVTTDLAGTEQSMKSVGDKVERAEIRSPVDGVVNNMTVRTVGGVVEPAMKLVEIIPSGDRLKIQARISPNDIAFIMPHQPVKVKLTAYDSTRYGYLEGEVSRVGASSVVSQNGDAFFEIEIEAKQNYLGEADHPLSISSGMIAEVNIITGHRSILNYLMKPLLRLKDRAFTER